MINELAGSPTRSENVYFANNEQASIAVFTAVFCFRHAKDNLIKLKLCNNWSAKAVNSISECAMWNSKKAIIFAHFKKLANQPTLNKAHVIEITKACVVGFMKARNSLFVWCRENKKNRRWWKYVSKGLDKHFLLTSSCSCSWPTFYQMDFRKRYWYVILLCDITKSRWDAQFVKKIPLEIVIVQQMKEEGYNKN